MFRCSHLEEGNMKKGRFLTEEEAIKISDAQIEVAPLSRYHMLACLGEDQLSFDEILEAFH